MRGQREQMRQAAIEEVCLDLGEAARFHVPLPLTTRIDCFCHCWAPFTVAQTVQRRDSGLKPAGHLANVGSISIPSDENSGADWPSSPPGPTINDRARKHQNLSSPILPTRRHSMTQCVAVSVDVSVPESFGINFDPCASAALVPLSLPFPIGLHHHVNVTTLICSLPKNTNVIFYRTWNQKLSTVT
jgi:hypothetical protein